MQNAYCKTAVHLQKQQKRKKTTFEPNWFSVGDHISHEEEFQTDWRV